MLARINAFKSPRALEFERPPVGAFNERPPLKWTAYHEETRYFTAHESWFRSLKDRLERSSSQNTQDEDIEVGRRTRLHNLIQEHLFTLEGIKSGMWQLKKASLSASASDSSPSEYVFDNSKRINLLGFLMGFMLTDVVW